MTVDDTEPLDDDDAGLSASGSSKGIGVSLLENKPVTKAGDVPSASRKKAKSSSWGGVLRKIKVFEYVVFTVIGALNGASVWGIIYYIFGGHLLLVGVLHIYTCLQQREKSPNLLAAIFQPLSWSALKDVFAPFLKYCYQHDSVPKGLDAKAYYCEGTFNVTIIAIIFIHFYIVILSIIDFLLPGLALNWYALTQPLIDVFLQNAKNTEKVVIALAEHGYSDRANYIFHTFYMPTLISLAFFMYSLINIKIFKIDYKYTFNFYMSDRYKKGIIIVLPFCLLLTFGLSFLLFFGSPALSILTDNFSPIQWRTHLSRFDAYILSLFSPVIVVLLARFVVTFVIVSFHICFLTIISLLHSALLLVRKK